MGRWASVLLRRVCAGAGTWSATLAVVDVYAAQGGKAPRGRRNVSAEPGSALSLPVPGGVPYLGKYRDGA